MNLRTTLRNIGPSDAITEYVGTRAAKLRKQRERVLDCHVVIERPHRHKTHGDHYRVRVALHLAGEDLVVTRDPPQRRENEDLYAAIDDAFDRAAHVLANAARRSA